MGGEEAPPDTVKASCASKAITILNAIEGYKDTTDLLARANALLQEEIAAEKEAEKEAWYAEALDLLNAGESEDAYDIFYILVDYKDSAEKREEAFLQKNIDCFGEDNHNAVMSFSKKFLQIFSS